jgi:hypothetical protein
MFKARGWHASEARRRAATAAAAHLLARADRRMVVANVAPARGSLELLDLQDGTSFANEGTSCYWRVLCCAVCSARGRVPRA